METRKIANLLCLPTMSCFQAISHCPRPPLLSGADVLRLGVRHTGQDVFDPAGGVLLDPGHPVAHVACQLCDQLQLVESQKRGKSCSVSLSRYDFVRILITSVPILTSALDKFKAFKHV